MNNKRLNLHVLGPQGSGKGTQSEILASKLDIVHIATGQLFRNRSKAGDEYAKHLKNILDAGKLVPVGIHERALEDEIAKHEKANGFVFDGAMRNIKQVKILESIWKKLNLDIPWIIVLEIDDKESIRRIETRRTCSKCGNIAIASNIDVKNIKCDQCGGNMVQRTDDTAEGITKRLQIYHSETLPIIEKYRKLNRTITIDGSPSIEAVTKSIFNQLKSRGII